MANISTSVVFYPEWFAKLERAKDFPVVFHVIFIHYDFNIEVVSDEGKILMQGSQVYRNPLIIEWDTKHSAIEPNNPCTPLGKGKVTVLYPLLPSRMTGSVKDAMFLL